MDVSAGLSQLEELLGWTPDFHDAEVVRIDLQASRSVLLLRTYVDPHTYIDSEITFYDVVAADLVGWRSVQNVVLSARFETLDTGAVQMTIDASVGMSGRIVAGRVEMTSSRKGPAS